jgi:6-phosphofructokinase 2
MVPQALHKRELRFRAQEPTIPLGGRMQTVITITPNPAIDICTAVAEVVPIRKLRCAAARRDPGGGGINVARVVQRLGGDVGAIYPAGGMTGKLLQRLVEREGVRSFAISVAEETREDFTVVDEKSGNQYRFVLPGPSVSEAEWTACLSTLEMMEQTPAYVVASGSLPPGVPDGFYAAVARIAKLRGSRVIVDTSGQALSRVLKEGVYLVKPNLRELQELVDASLPDENSQVNACRKLIAAGSAEIVVLTLGADGALLVTSDAAYVARAPEIPVVSAVGAGDSFVGGMVRNLAGGSSVVDAFRYGVAAGSAAVLNPGTELCHSEDVARLYNEIELVLL